MPFMYVNIQSKTITIFRHFIQIDDFVNDVTPSTYWE